MAVYLQARFQRVHPRDEDLKLLVQDRLRLQQTRDLSGLGGKLLLDSCHHGLGPSCRTHQEIIAQHHGLTRFSLFTPASPLALAKAQSLRGGDFCPEVAVNGCTPPQRDQSSEAESMRRREPNSYSMRAWAGLRLRPELRLKPVRA